MARKLELQTNVVAPGGSYPYGRIKNDTGSGDGTPVSEALYGDMHQFFARLMALGGVTPNNNPDNTANGFQLVEALQKYVHPDWTTTGITYFTIGPFTWADNDATGTTDYPVSYKNGINEIMLAGSATLSSTSTPGDIGIITLPSGARPAKRQRVLARVIRSGTPSVESIIIENTGEVKVTMMAGTFTNVTVIFDGIRIRKS